MFFDTHAHLTDPAFDADRDQVLERAVLAGVSRITEIADSPKDWDAAVALSRANPGRVFCSLGLHPYYASQLDEALLLRLKEKLSLPEVVAIGEIGLDYAKSPEPRDIQLKNFEILLEKCLEWEKPAVIHCREAYEDLRKILGRLCPKPPLPQPSPASGRGGLINPLAPLGRGQGEGERRYWGVVHCFSGNVEDALFCASLGFALGIDGPVTYPKNEILRQAIKAAGLFAVVLETDSPYLPPQGFRGQRNEPAKVVETAKKIAELFDLPLEDIASATAKNACDLYGITL